jgi:adenylate kinase
MRMIFLGPPGVGKGTHAAGAGEHYGIPKISTGDILRDEIKKDSELGKRAQEYMDAGRLVPDKVVIEILKNRISRGDCIEGFILDGFPRTLEQAGALERIAEIDLVVNFKLSHENLMQRLGGRLTCRKCEAIYHVKNNPPKREGVCDLCGSGLYTREDQKPEVIEVRIKTYEKQTRPLIDYYRKKGLLVDFNAEGEVKDVNRRLIKLIDGHMNQ